MAQVLIRNIEDDVIEQLKLKANIHGRSLEQELREILKQAAPLSPAQKMELSLKSRAMTPKGVKQTRQKFSFGKIEMTLIVDASVAIKWGVEEDGSLAAHDLLSESGLIAPDLIVAEVTNALWNKAVRGEITKDQRELALTVCLRSLDELAGAKPFAARALEIAVSLRHPAYDCFYLALAEQRGGTFVTADARLLSRLEQRGWAGRVRAL